MVPAETVNRYNSLAPVLEMLGQKYGVDANDADALSKAIEEDSSFYEDEAVERGMSVEQLKEIKKMERENRELKARMDRERNQQQVDQILMKWNQESNDLKQVYPDFDFDMEMQTNEKFKQLLQSNIDVRTAYEVTHLNDIIPAAMNFTAHKVEEKVTNKIRAGQNRPAEGAMGNRSSVVVKSDVSKLTNADMQEIFRRVANGEKISSRARSSRAKPGGIWDDQASSTDIKVRRSGRQPGRYFCVCRLSCSRRK